MFGDDQADARTHQCLLGIEHIKRRALTNLGLVAHVADTWLSALRRLFAVCSPLNGVWAPLTPIERGVVQPLMLKEMPLGSEGGTLQGL
jgi:hypothetical protein